jgi:hypothetical protein
MYQYSKGVSIYFPWSEIYQPYRDRDYLLDFLKDTCWLKFIKAYIEKTQRPRNPGHDFEGQTEKFRVKDDFPRTKGSDDLAVRAKNPPHKWDVPDCLWSYFETLLQ